MLEATRKLTKILRSKATSDINVIQGDLVQVFQKLEKEERGNWLLTLFFLSIDPSTISVTVPGSAGGTITAAIEDIKHTITEESFAGTAGEENESLDT